MVELLLEDLVLEDLDFGRGADDGQREHVLLLLAAGLDELLIGLGHSLGEVGAFVERPGGAGAYDGELELGQRTRAGDELLGLLGLHRFSRVKARG